MIGDPAAILTNPADFPTATVGRDTNNLPGIPNSGTLLSVTVPYANADKRQDDGIDVDIIWKQSLKDWGNLTTEFQWTHVIDYTQTQGGTPFKYVGTSGNYNVSSGSGTPEDRWNLIMGWQRGPWNVTGTVRYVSGYDEIPYQGLSSNVNDSDTACLGLQYAGTNCTVASFTTLDLSANYTGFKNWQIFGSIINVFNRVAPYAPAAAYGHINYNYNYALSGATGTTFNLGVRYTFGAAPSLAQLKGPEPAPPPAVTPPAPTPPPPPPPPAPAPPPQVQKITLDSKVLFDFDKAVLKPEGKAAIDSQVVGKLAQIQRLEVVLVTGHADRLGTEAYNQKLSQRRADAVREYLVSKGVDKAKIETIGMGEKQPVVQCDQKNMKQLIECLQPNRRVDVQVKGDTTK